MYIFTYFFTFLTATTTPSPTPGNNNNDDDDNSSDNSSDNGGGKLFGFTSVVEGLNSHYHELLQLAVRAELNSAVGAF